MIKLWCRSALKGRAELVRRISRSYSWKETRQKVESLLEKLLSKLPVTPYPLISRILIGANIATYILINIVASDRDRDRFKYNPVVSQFLNKGLIRLGINSFMIYHVANLFETANGRLALAKVVLTALTLGIALCTVGVHKYGEFNYFGNDATFQGILFAMLLKTPSAALQISPIPVAIPCCAIAAGLALIDLLAFSPPAFGGVISGLLYAKNFI